MNILVTGCNGMLGRDLCAVLSDVYDVWGLDIHKGPFNNNRFILCDVTDSKSVENVVKELQPRIIVHCAAWTDVDACEENQDKAKRINVEGTENLASIAKQINALIFYMSTDYIFNGGKDSPYVEDDQPNPINYYGRTKLEGENAVKESKASYIVLRTSWLFGGERENNNFVNAVINQYDSGKSLRVVKDQKGRPTYTKDFAKALMHVIEYYKNKNDVHEIMNIANEDEITWFTFAKIIIERISHIRGGAVPEIIPISSNELNRPAKRPKNSVLDTEKYTGKCKNKLRSWRSALDEYFIRLNIEERKIYS